MSFDIIGGLDYVEKQLKKHLSILHDLEEADIEKLNFCLPDVFSKVQECWSEISNKYYNRDGVITLDIKNSNQYAQLLLILARQLNVEECSSLADKVFGLNKMLNGCDIYHAVQLPTSFYIDHTLGIVLGRAQLGERLFLSQNCTIGGNYSASGDDYPILGKDNYLLAHATLVGNVRTGDRIIFAANSLVKDMEIPSDSIVFGISPDNIIKNLKPDRFKEVSPFNQN